MALEPRRPAALFLAPEAPYPLAGGGALRSASLLEYLSLRYDVDCIVFRQPGAADPAALFPPGRVRSVTVVDLPANGRGLTARALRNAARVARRVPPLVDRFAGFESQIARALEGRRYQLGLVEHSWCAPYLEQISPVCERTVLDLHNVESLLHGRCAHTAGRAAALAHGVFEEASRKLEKFWLPRFSEVLATSEIDAALARAIAPQARILVYPNALPPVARPAGADEEVVVFSGNMEYHPNQTAVAFFRREVWPALRERWPNLTWRLVGKNAHAVTRYIEGDPRIQVTGAVDDAVRELARARVAVVPLLTGSGTRLKILEAWAAGIPVVSTTIGAEGLPACDGETLLLADGAAPFAAAVTRLLTCYELRQKIGNAGRLLLEKEFTWETAWKKLDF
uniref:Glycosyl transferase, group 1 n=1 Tax=Solibacter usitatus (strain Ellin6076) TaxID=234267 RepID=Q01T64_SOLUE